MTILVLDNHAVFIHFSLSNTEIVLKAFGTEKREGKMRQPKSSGSFQKTSILMTTRNFLRYRRRICLTLMICLCGLILCFENATAEPDWVKKAVAASSGYSVDPEAPLLVLHDVACVRISPKGHSERTVQIALRVLSQTGTEETYLVEEVGESRTVEGLKGWRIDTNGKCHKLDKKNVVEVDLDNATGYYDDAHQLVAAFPEVHTGDVVAYEYKVKKKGGWEAFYQGFTFQLEPPVVYTRFDVTLPADWGYFVSGNNVEAIEHIVNGSNLCWTFTDLTYCPEEPLMPPRDRVTRDIRINCYNPSDTGTGHFPHWRSVSRWAADLFNRPSIPTAPLAKKANELVADISDRWVQFCAIADYVRDEVRYVAVEIGEGRFKPRPCGTTWSNRYGDCKDKATLMQAMLRAINILGKPVLANVDVPVDPDFPSPLQFNHVILAVSVDAISGINRDLPASVDGWLYFDPTAEGIPPGQLPSYLHGTRVLKVSDEDSVLTMLPPLDYRTQKRVYRAVANLHEDNSVSAEVCVLDLDACAYTVRHERSSMSADDIISDWRERFAESMRNPVISNVETGGSGDSTWITFSLVANNYLDFAGRFGLLKADFFHCDKVNELSEKERVHPIWFGRANTYETDITWILPECWSVSEAPASDSASSESASMRSKVTIDGTTIHLATVVEYTGNTEPVNKYADARSFYRSLRTAYETRILLEKN